MESKRLMIVVDSAAELNFHWQFSLKDLVADIVRYLHPKGSTCQDPGAPRPCLGLIVYGSQGPCTELQVQPWGWTYDLGTFLRWLSSVSFTSSESSEDALAFGLSVGLKIIAASKDENEAQLFGRNHCILITSCKSLPNDKMLELEHDNISLRQKERFPVDATSVAKRFVESFVSLSIISPKQSPKLKDIFRMGNVDKPMADCCTDDQDDLSYLILLSENFMESHDALSYRDFLVEPTAENDKGKDLDFVTDAKKLYVASPLRVQEKDKLVHGAWPIIPQTSKFAMNRLELGGPAQTHCFTASSKSHLGTGTSKEHIKLKKSAPLVDFGGSSRMGPLKKTYLRSFPTEQMPQDEHRVKRRLANALGQSNKSNSAGSGNWVVSSEQGPEYIKAWEGDVTVMQNGETVVVDRLVVHRMISTSEMHFNYWPDRLHMEKLIPKTQVDEMHFLGNVKYIFVDAMRPKSELHQLAMKDLCVYIRLPQQTLLLHPAERSRFLGVLYPRVLNIPSRLV